MKNLLISYSPVYDRTLAKLAGGTYKQQDARDGFRFEKEFQKFWNKNHLDRVFLLFEKMGFKTYSTIFAYPIRGTWGKKYIFPYADPLTFHITRNFTLAAGSVIHELCHHLFWFTKNKKIRQSIEDGREKISKRKSSYPRTYTCWTSP